MEFIGKVAGGLEAIVNLPKAQRETNAPDAGRDLSPDRHHAQHGDHPAGPHPLQPANDDFLREATRLDNDNEWMQAQREFRLCCSLRVALRETETLAAQ